LLNLFQNFSLKKVKTPSPVRHAARGCDAVCYNPKRKDSIDPFAKKRIKLK